MINSKRKPNLIQSDRGKEFYNKVFQDFLNEIIIKLYSRNSSIGSVLLKTLIVQSEIYFKNQYLKNVTVTGLMFYLQ